MYMYMYMYNCIYTPSNTASRVTAPRAAVFYANVSQTEIPRVQLHRSCLYGWGISPLKMRNLMESDP